MPWNYSEEYYREYTRTSWNESAEAYARFMAVLAPFGTELLEELGPRPGERILDMGTGPGEPALTIARHVGPSGQVVGIDLSERMIELAKEAARAQHAGNAEFRVMDCSKLELPSGQFDAVVSRFGFQIFTDPEQAAREAFRVTRPDGRIVLSVWGEGPKVPFIDVIIGPMLEHAEPDESGYIPTPYEMGGPGEMVRLLEAAGFSKSRERRVSHIVRFSSEQEYLDTVLSGTPIGHSLSEETPEVQRDVLSKTRANLKARMVEGEIRLPAEAVFVSARH